MKSFLQTARHKLNKLDLLQCRSMCEHMAHNIEFFSSVFDSLRLGIVVVDIEGKVRMSNKMAKVISGNPILVQTHVWQIFRESALAHDIQRAIENKEDFEFREYSLTSQRDAHLTPVMGTSHITKTLRCALLPLVEQKDAKVTFDTHADENDTVYPSPRITKSPISHKVVTGSVLCLEDVSAEREIEHNVYRDKSFTSMKHITAGIAHEIKNPLSAISLHLELLRRKIQNAEKMLHNEAGKNNTLKYIEIIQDEIQAMDKIVSVFLNNFTIQRSDLEPKDMTKLLHDVLRFVELDLKNHGVIVTKKLDDAIPRVLISTHAITHVLLNIIKNAIEAMDSGGELRITMNHSDGKVHTTISDTGRGIDMAVQKSIFDPYFTTKSKGSGIGLTIAYKLVRLHGGTLELNASYTEGASFIVSLPAYADEQRLLSNT